MKIKETFRVLAAWKIEYVTEKGELFTVEKPLRKGIVVLKISPGKARELAEYLTVFAKKKDWRKKQLDVEISEHREKRNLDQNALYWALISILTHISYGCHGYEDEVHEGILQVYSPRVEEKATKRLIPKRSKDMNVGEFAELIQGVFHEIAAQGVPVLNAPDIKRYWEEFYKWRWKDGTDLLVFKSLEDYRSKVNYCEACMKYLDYDKDAHKYMGEHNGEICHIVTKGAGAGNTPDEVFHFCIDDHVDQHKKGWEAFLEKYPHLTPKVNKARELAGKKPIEQEKEDLQEEETISQETELEIF